MHAERGMSADVLCHNPPQTSKGGMDALLSPIRVNPKDPAGLYPARAPAGYALFRKRTAVLATSRERAADMYRSATVQNGTQWNIDGEELREKQLPHLALDTLSEVIEKLIEALRRVGANIYLYTHACSFFHNVKQVSRDFGIQVGFATNLAHLSGNVLKDHHCRIPL